jgi:hypothetical protein
MNQSIGTQNDNLENLRARLRKMTDKQLVEFGKDVRYLCSPVANFHKPPLEVWAAQLREGCEEWRRRHPKTEKSTK